MHIQSQAGILTSDGSKLSDPARNKFVDDVIDQMQTGGEANVAFPCGPSFNPIPSPNLLADLHDPELYPAFHTLFVGTYETIAKILNIPGQTPLMPICDPFAVALKLNVPFPEIDLPTLFATIALPIPLLIPALDLTIPPIKLALKLPTLADIPPKLPDFKLPGIPDPIPEIYFDALFDFFKLMTFQVPQLALPILMAKIPDIIPNLSLNAIFKIACESVYGALPPVASDLFSAIAGTKVLATKTAECLAFTAIGLLLGCPSTTDKSPPKDNSPPPPPPEDQLPRQISEPAVIPPQPEPAPPADTTPPSNNNPSSPPNPSAGGVGLVGIMGASRGYTNSQIATKNKEEPTELLQFVGAKGKLTDTSQEFREKLVQVANRLEINPNFLAAAITLETAGTYSPTVENPSSKAIGLIQFTDFVIKTLETTRDELLALSNIQQLDFVEKFFNIVTHNGKRKLKTPGDCYLAIFASAFVGSSPTTIVFKSPDIRYKQNMGFDPGAKGHITVLDITNNITGLYQAAKRRGAIS